MNTLKRAGKSVSGGRLWHVISNGKTVGHVVEILGGDMYAIHADPNDPGAYYLAMTWDVVCCSLAAR